ncbi:MULTISPECIES: pilus assembly protein TadG-related protein [unclassified Vibrio]|uniref:pilus assembly protein TadG-related protein n=1 Tax=unclassified Vibrio TaxID=2614977 RepID=UPI000C85AFE6|nr:pilus assembly protein TadG-related protein [Vibrio sp. 10N.261.54.E10]PMK07961.1 pilus assembly protein TadG [Vibrio sp. 10N.261.54.E10]
MINPNTFNRGPHRQRGIAAIWLGLTLIPLLGVSVFALEGTRYIQETSRLRDAAQAAALAITIDDKSNEADALATRYVDDYVRSIEHIDITTVRTYEEPTAANDDTEKIQYEVAAVTTHNSWFASNLIPSFDENQKLAGSALAAKYPYYLGDKLVDIVLVTDFSGSMNRDWSGASGDVNTKIQTLKLAVSDLADNILVVREGDSTVLNRLAIVPFNLRVQDKINNNLFSGSQLRYRSDYHSSVSSKTYEKVNWRFWSKRTLSEVEDCADDIFDCPNIGNNNQHKQAKRVLDVLNIKSRRLEIPEYIDYQKSVDDMFNYKRDNTDLKFDFRADTNVIYNSSMTMTNGIGHYVIPLTSDSDLIEEMQDMNSGGNTASYQGILRGLQVLNDGMPSNSASQQEIDEYSQRVKIMIILSDGQEYPYTSILPDLVDANMCNAAREHFQSENGSLYIGVIGVDFDATKQNGFQKCVLNPDEDIIDVRSREELIERIQNLIEKGSRGTGVSRLYG